MGKRKDIKKNYPAIKEMYENGCSITQIATTLDLSRPSIYNAICIMGISRRAERKEQELSQLTYADNRPPVLEKLIENGKRYTDVTPLYSPR